MCEGVNNPADMSGMLARVTAMQTDVMVIRTKTDAMTSLTETGGILTTDGTEQTIYINELPSGVFRPVCLKINFTNHTAAETVVLREYYRNRVGGAYVRQDEVSYVGVPANLEIEVTLSDNRFGFKVTIEKTAGANRDYEWAVFSEI